MYIFFSSQELIRCLPMPYLCPRVLPIYLETCPIFFPGIYLERKSVPYDLSLINHTVCNPDQFFTSFKHSTRYSDGSGSALHLSVCPVSAEMPTRYLTEKITILDHFIRDL